MAITLYDTTVRNYLQTLGAIAGVLEKGAKHCAETGIDPTIIVDTKLAEDMLPFSFQVLSVTHHSMGAIAAAKAGVFKPPGKAPEGGFPALQKLVADTIGSLKAETPEEINALEGKDVIFQLSEQFKMPFTAEGFLASFSLPNFYFHASMTYAILRAKGAKLGKRDFMGQMRLKG